MRFTLTNLFVAGFFQIGIITKFIRKINPENFDKILKKYIKIEYYFAD